ncbi:MAG: hypothetical protein RR685_10200 [Hungatella sp.]
MMDRRKQQLKLEGIETEKIETKAQEYIRILADGGYTVYEAELVIKQMDCILNEGSKCNPPELLKNVITQKNFL